MQAEIQVSEFIFGLAKPQKARSSGSEKMQLLRVCQIFLIFPLAQPHFRNFETSTPTYDVLA